MSWPGPMHQEKPVALSVLQRRSVLPDSFEIEDGSLSPSQPSTS